MLWALLGSSDERESGCGSPLRQTCMSQEGVPWAVNQSMFDRAHQTGLSRNL